MERAINLGVGAMLVAGAFYLAARFEPLALLIHNYYAHQKEKKRRLGWFGAQFVPGAVASRIVAASLVAFALLFGLYLVGMTIAAGT